MRILLFVCSIYNTFENVKKEDFINIIDKLCNIAEIEQDDKIIISFCDNTENINILMNYFSVLMNDIDKDNIFLGKQFLGDVYYNNIIHGGALLYNKKLTKEEKIAEYVKDLENNDNFINLYYIDGLINMDLMNELFKDDKNIICNFIKEENNGKCIIEKLDMLLNKKKLTYNNEFNIEK